MSNLLRKTTIVALLMLTAGMMLSSPAKAVSIIDTGQGGTSPSGLVLQAYQVSTSNTYSYNAWVAAEFTLDSQYVITDVLGWMAQDRRPEYNLFRIKIYGDGGDIPNASEYLSRDFAISTAYRTEGWNGLRGLNLTLDAGTYWVAFEVPDVIDMNGTSVRNLSHAAMSNIGVPNPLGNEAWLYQGNWLGDDGDNLNFGVQILGNIQTIDPAPEPATIMLLGIGLLGIAGVSRRKN